MLAKRSMSKKCMCLKEEAAHGFTDVKLLKRVNTMSSHDERTIFSFSSACFYYSDFASKS